ncbi:MAG: ferritin-like domain-containing protein [Sandaracinaceae bacterium]|nr:ferritin-like domain-containing protein [Sandaracinaceae bacterium]
MTPPVDMDPPIAPPAGTLERWAFDYVTSASLDDKLSPPPLPRSDHDEAWEPSPPSRRTLRPGRPPTLVCVPKKPKTPTGRALLDPAKRARLLHVFLHHELQAAELFAWAMLTFVEAPRALRAGWLKLLLDEVRHMRLYDGELRRLGARFGDFPVRDWFWERVPACPSAASFLALVGVGLEGGNLDHGARFAAMLEEAGDPEAAAVERRIAFEEIAHVRFAVQWLDKLGVPLEGLADLEALLPPPLSPIVLRGRPLAREARLDAGVPLRLVEELDRYEETLRAPRASG